MVMTTEANGDRHAGSPSRPKRRRATRVFGGLAALPVQLRFCLSVLRRWLFERRRYPLLYLRASRHGFLETIKLLERLRLTKVIRVGRRYHFSLVEPRWPSEAYDHLIANGGLNLGGAGTPAKRQIDLAILGITRACGYRCAHCYERNNLASADAVSEQRWKSVIEELQQIGVSVVALSGGEPLARFDRTLRLLRSADKTRSDFHLFTTGHGATRERVAALVEAGLAAVGVGLDHVEPSRQDAFRGHKGAFDNAVSAVRLFGEAGVLTYLNVCLSHDLVHSEGLWRLHALGRALGVGAVQLLEPKPCGGYASRQVRGLFSAEDRRRTLAFFEATHQSRAHRDGPAVYYPAFMEAPDNLGCMMGGLSHLHIDSLGHVEPCVFVPVSFGNVNAERFGDIYDRMRRAIPRPLHARCPSLQLAERVGFGGDAGRALPVPYESIEAEWSRLYGGSDWDCRPNPERNAHGVCSPERASGRWTAPAGPAQATSLSDLRGGGCAGCRAGTAPAVQAERLAG
jgi:MoaA/NifB/PqqE/SkfB family radical SAM enzyme